jgi:hypothetical protein
VVYQHLLNRIAKLTLGNSALKSIFAEITQKVYQQALRETVMF